MKINHTHRKRIKAYLNKFYKIYNRETFTVFHFVKFFKERLKNDKDAWIGVSGSTGCLTGDTKLKDCPWTLKELYKLTKGDYFRTTSYDFEQNKEVISLSKIIDSGKKKVYKITTKSGKVIDASEDHKFFVEENGKVIEKTLGELKNGSKILKCK